MDKDKLMARVNNSPVSRGIVRKLTMRKGLNKRIIHLFLSFLVSYLLINLSPFLWSQAPGIQPYISLPQAATPMEGSDWRFLQEVLRFSYNLSSNDLQVHQPTTLEELGHHVLPTYTSPTPQSRSIPVLLNQLVIISFAESGNRNPIYSLALPSTIPQAFSEEIQEINASTPLYLAPTLNESYLFMISGEVKGILTTAIHAFDLFHSEFFQDSRHTLPDGTMFTVDPVGPLKSLHLSAVSNTPELIQPINYAIRMGRFSGEFQNLFNQWFLFDEELPVQWNMASLYPLID